MPELQEDRCTCEGPLARLFVSVDNKPNRCPIHGTQGKQFENEVLGLRRRVAELEQQLATAVASQREWQDFAKACQKEVDHQKHEVARLSAFVNMIKDEWEEMQVAKELPDVTA